MKTKSVLLGSALLAIAVTLAFAWRTAQAARAAEAERATLLAARAAQDAATHRLEERLAAAVKNRTAVEAAIAAARTARKPTAPVPGAAASGKGPMAGGLSPMELIAKDPKLQLLYLAAVRADFATRYGPFIVAGALTPEQVERLTDAKVRWREQDQDLRAVALKKKLPASDPSLVEMRKRAADEQRAAQVAVLGEAGYEELQRYERTIPMREMADRFAGAAAIGDVPMTPQQTEQLTRAMADAHGARGPVDLSKIDWAAVDAKAQEILSPAQFWLFQRTEPMGGGMSRWTARFERLYLMARGTGPAAAKPGG